MAKNYIKIIPSPYKVVKEYEDIFTQEGINFIAEQVERTLSYIKNNTHKYESVRKASTKKK
jgi:hypothetical protein